MGLLGQLDEVMPMRCLEQGLAVFTGSARSPPSLPPAPSLLFLLKARAQLPLCLLPTQGHPSAPTGVNRPKHRTCPGSCAISPSSLQFFSFFFVSHRTFYSNKILTAPLRYNTDKRTASLGEGGVGAGWPPPPPVLAEPRAQAFSPWAHHVPVYLQLGEHTPVPGPVLGTVRV